MSFLELLIRPNNDKTNAFQYERLRSPYLGVCSSSGQYCKENNNFGSDEACVLQNEENTIVYVPIRILYLSWLHLNQKGLSLNLCLQL